MSPGLEMPTALNRGMRMGTLGLLALVGAAMLGGIAAQSPVALHRPVWNPALDVSGRPSPDGRMFSYIDWTTGDIAVRDLVSGENRRLTTDGAWEPLERIGVNSVWSPDGSTIAYAWSNADVPEIRVIPVTGGSPRVIFRDERIAAVRVYDWSRDGSVLAMFRDRQGRVTLVTVPAAGGDARELIRLGLRRPSNAGFSPDGLRIVYDLPRDERTPQRDIFILSVATERQTALIRHDANDYGPAWSPDGKRIVFATDRSGPVGAWEVEVDGPGTGKPRLLAADIARMLPLGFTRDGTLFYARATFENSGDVVIAPLDVEDGPAASGPALLSTANIGRNTSPSWSPDGRQIAFVAQGNVGHGGFGAAAVVIRDVATGHERRLMPQLDRLLAPRHSPPRWSPDGRHLLVTGADAAQRLGLYLVSLQNGDARLVVPMNDRGRPTRPSWTRDGRHIVFIRSGDGDRVISLDLDTGIEHELHRGRAHTVAASPTDDRVAFSNLDELMVIPGGGGAPRSLLRVNPEEVLNLVGGLAWTPDGKHLVFVRGARSNPGETGVLWSVPANGGEARKLELDLGTLARRAGIQRYGIRDLAIHPRVPTIAFTTGLGGLQAELWALPVP